jgi:wobble nucleotide-excising tRNase
MKLDRFAKIRHRIFKDFTWPVSLENFGRYNLIYGWNGTGKTTLSSLFKAVETATAVTEGQVEFIFDNNRVLGSDLSTATLPQVRVFNRETVSRSVFESISGSLGQLPAVYVFGEESAEKQRQVDALKKKLPALLKAANEASVQVTQATKDLNDVATNKAREIKNLLVAPGGSFNSYNAGDFKEHISQFESNPVPPLSSEERQIFLDLKDAKPLTSLAVPPINFPDVIGLQQEAREALAKTVVSSIINELTDNPTIASWVSNGLTIHTHDGDAVNCKFCEQPLPPERLRQLEAHFNDQFRQFTNSLKGLAERIENASKTLDGVALVSASALYPELQAEYDRECSQLNAHLRNVRQGLIALAHAVKTKQGRVFESLDLENLLNGGDGTPDSSKSILLTLLKAIGTGLPAFGEFLGKNTLIRIQDIIQKHNQKTDSFIDQVKDARMKLHKHELGLALPRWQEAVKKLKETKSALSAAQQEKDTVETNIKELEVDILQHRQPADELNRELAAYLGHDEIQVVVEDTGYRLMRRDSLATNLSEGERTAIAFLYFLKSLNDRSFDLENGIVVVDDPISSLDSNSAYNAFGFMKRKLSNAGQLFVLTHNFTLLRQVRNWFHHTKPSRFYMLKASYLAGERYSVIDTLDPFLRNFESEYHYLFKRILDAAELPNGEPLQTYYELPNLARRLLESFLAFKIPNEKNLHSRLEAIDFDGPKKTRIIRFLDTHSHAEQIGDGHDESSALAEAPEVLQDLLALIQKHDGVHFDRMKQAARLV